SRGHLGAVLRDQLCPDARTQRRAFHTPLCFLFDHLLLWFHFKAKNTRQVIEVVVNLVVATIVFDMKACLRSPKPATIDSGTNRVVKLPAVAVEFKTGDLSG